MADDKRERQRTNRQARLAAQEEARRKAARKRQAITVGAVMVVVFGVLVLVNRGGGDGKEVATDTSTTSVPVATTAASASSTAGKPCVARTDPLPEGAPEVAVRTGPPPTQLVTEDITVGTGAEVKPGATVKANYIGVSCSTGKIFDSSYSRGEATEFPLTGVIKGWTDGIPGMKVGGKRLLGIPSDQAYGTAGRPGIAPDEALWFVVEIVETS